MNNLEKIEKFYGLCISDERLKNLKRYEKLLEISIDTSLSENAREKSIDYYKKKKLVVEDWHCGLGAIGCTLSFNNIYENIVKNKYKYSIIFEDDIDWNEEFYGKCSREKFIKELNKINFDEKWDIFYLGTEAKGYLRNQKLIKDNIYELECGKINIPLKDKSFKSIQISRKSNPVIHKNFGGQQAIILTYNGAVKLLKYHKPALDISDGIVGFAISNHDIVNRAFIPTLFTQLSHPRLGKYKNKLWASTTGGKIVKTNEKYDPNMKKYKKGCSEFPLSEKYKWKEGDEEEKYKKKK